MFRFRAIVAVCALIFGVGAAEAQTGSIQGTVNDGAGASIPHASVKAFDQEKNIVARETTTNGEGFFNLSPLLPGQYSVRIQAPGFKESLINNLTLDQTQIMGLGVLVLQLGQLSESVSVESQAAQVETTTAQKSFVISSKEVTQIPLNGRDFQTLMRTLPGVVSNDTSDFRLAFNNTNSFNVNGQRGSSNNVFLDGAINTDVGANDGQYTQISLDAVGEFKLQTSAFNAEYGRNPGVMISINTKSGGSQFHGTAYEFLRNDALDARKPFDTTGAVAKLRFNQFGANLGGPVLIPHFSTGDHKKLFFFFNYEGTRATRPLNSNTFVDVPSAQILSGDFRQLYRFNSDGSPVLNTNSTFPQGTVFQPGTIVRDSQGRAISGVPYPNNTVPMSQWNQNAPAFLKMLNFINRAGAPQTPNTPEQVRVPFAPAYKFDKNAKVARVDYNVSPKMNFFFRWADDAQQEQQDIGIFNTLPYPIYPQFREKPGASWSWNLVNVISPRTTNEFIFAYNHLTQVVDVAPGTDKNSYDRTALGFKFQELYPAQNTRNRFPSFSCGIGSCNFSPFQANWRSEGKTYAWTDNLTHTLGTHTLKTGIYFNWNDNGQQPGWSDALNVNFAPNASNPNDTNNQFANMLLGNFTTASQTRGIYFGAFRFFVTEAFVQDSWKVSNKLTLEYGIRWAYEGPTYTRGKYLQSYFEPNLYNRAQSVSINTAPGITNGTIIAGSGNLYNGLVLEGTGGLPLGGVKHRYNNWAPRIGIAYDPFGDGKTAIRIGGGVFYERVQQNVYNFGGLGNPPLVSTPTFYGGNIDQISPALLSAGTIAPVSVNAIDPSGKIPTTYSWSFDVQREIGARTSLDVGYVGNIGRHLQYNRDLGQLPLNTTTAPGSTILTAVNNTTNAIRPYPGFTSINYTEFGATSNYNALQTRLSRRFATHLTLNASYTWSKAMDEVDADGNAITYYLDRRRDYARAGFDRTHVLSVDYVYELPAFSQNEFLKRVVNGWTLAGITRFATGPPLNITSNGNLGTLGGAPRANYLGGQIYPDNQSRLEFFNPLVFGRPLDGQFGNLGRNALVGPGINQWDISVYKSTQISERVQAQIRVETFNTFNHTQWAGVNTGISGANPGSPVSTGTIGTSGQVTTTRDPRNIQLGVKILF
ncbi:MAG: Plug and carboxypeptidase regulatory-like domain-containing protein [Acidobacteriota bacterium]|nr:Plug and carboxypeptidase regulatory-like domain-containing protein [Acidobacteriota bacterium]